MMSISYIRFFSPTQLLPDGLLILFMFVLIYFSIKLTILILGDLSEDGFSNKMKNFQFTDERIDNIEHYNIKIFHLQNKTGRISPVFNPLFSIIFLIIFIPYFIYTIFILPDEEFTFVSLIVSTPIFAVLLFLSYVSIISIINSDVEKYVIKKIKTFPYNALSFLNLMLLLCIIIIPFKTFHNVYMFPDNLVNVRNIQINKDDNNTKISYMNDKYIFLEHKHKDKSISIEILKFDKLFAP